MEQNILWIDGGTTNTRLTLTAGEQILARSVRRAGAADADRERRNSALAAAVAEETASLRERFRIRIDALVLSGMITSGNGLCEVPHIPAPAGIGELAAGIRVTELPEILPDTPVLCIPGVRTGGERPQDRDMMRGEETEVLGDLDAHDTAGRRLYLHFGSHNKAILLHRRRIVDSRTTLGGELLQAVTAGTILRSSAGAPEGFVPDAEWIRRGCALGASEGVSRALFGARLFSVLDGAGPAQVRSLIYGVLAGQDLKAFAGLLAQEPEELVLYGRGEFIEAFRCCAGAAAAAIPARIIPYADSERMSLQGMRAICKRRGILK